MLSKIMVAQLLIKSLGTYAYLISLVGCDNINLPFEILRNGTGIVVNESTDMCGNRCSFC